MSHLTFLDTITNVTGANTNRLEPVKSLPTLATGLQQLRAPDGMVAVLGNHDQWNDPRLVQTLQALGIKILANDLTQIQRGTAQIQIAGVKDFMVKQADLQPILTKMGTAKGAILLAHEPDFADISVTTGKFDLQLSGHSHGGQVHIPGLKRITPPLGKKYPAGQYQIQQMIQYTSRGLGLVTPRVRFNCRPEITVVTLRSPLVPADLSPQPNNS
jgi:predicted MPP superfamily phosphohydrolase